MQNTSLLKLTTEMAEDSEKTPWSKRQRRSTKEETPKRKQYIVSENRQYINNSLYWARKYARIFVLGHYPSRKANRFPRATLLENCELRGTDNVQISEHVFVPNGGYCVYYC